MGFIQSSFFASRSSLSVYLFVVLITVTSSPAGAAAGPNTFPEIEPLEVVDGDQILLSLESSEQQPLATSHLGGGDKRSWQNLQGSWGKRGTTIGSGRDYDRTNQLPPLITADDLHDYEDDSSNPLNYELVLRTGPHQQAYLSEQKRAWKAMNGAWGKRLSNGGGGGGDWNKFRGSWGKREPGWNNLKGLWGKRSTNWNKLQSAWGKRDISHNIIPSTF